MSKLDSTESQDLSNSSKPKSAAASRILRAVEMGRTQPKPGEEPAADAANETPSKGPEPAPAAATAPIAATAATHSVTDESQESLRSLSAATAGQPAADTPSAAASPAGRVSATKAGLAAAAKMAAAEGNDKTSPAAQALRNRTEEPAKTAEPASPAPFSGVVSPAPGFWAKLPAAGKIGVIVLALAIGAGLVYQLSKSSAAKARAVGQAAPQFVLLPGVAGWSPKWAGEQGRLTGRSISLFRDSQPLSNYKLEFEGQVESKALGWVFRAQDPKNYYAYKIEVIKPGLEQLMALSRIVMINGVEAQRHYTPLKSPVRPSHTFHVRMEARGSQFNTWIGDQLIEAWQDDRLRSGGVGLLQDKDESSQIHKLQIFEMR